MDFIFSFLGSLLGAFLGSFVFLYYVNPKEVISEGKKLEKKLDKDFVPKGVVLKSPDPESERKRKMVEFEKKVYTRREQVTNDLR